MKQDASSAMEFLVSRVIEQAEADRVPLSDVEKRMLSFTQPAATPADRNVAEAFDREYDSAPYEAKIAKLINRAYRRDKESGADDLWRRSLKTLNHVDPDCYFLVMAEQAQINIPGSRRAFASAFLDAQTIALAVVGLAGFVLLFPLRRGHPPIAGDYIHNGVLRGALYFVWIGFLWGIGQISK